MILRGSVFFVICCLILIPSTSVSDTLYFVAGDPENKNKTIWPVELITLDAASGIAEFRFHSSDRNYTREIHVTRILSLEFDDRTFTPSTLCLKDTVSESIGGNLEQPNYRYLEVDKEVIDLNPNLRSRGENTKVTLQCSILRYNKSSNMLDLNCLKKDRTTVKINSIPKHLVSKWIRR